MQKWNLSGDGTLNIDNIKHIQEAVKQSVLNISDSISHSGTSVDVYRKKVWDYVPDPSDPETKKVTDAVFKEYQNISTGKLIAKGVELIKNEFMELVSELKKENAIEPRRSGILHPINTIGNFINDHT